MRAQHRINKLTLLYYWMRSVIPLRAGVGGYVRVISPRHHFTRFGFRMTFCSVLLRTWQFDPVESSVKV
jgi:hypothetical protein